MTRHGPSCLGPTGSHIFKSLPYRKSCARSRLVFDEQLVSEMAEGLHRAR